jgi:glycerophosphoryl diester phosphodiesterase
MGRVRRLILGLTLLAVLPAPAAAATPALHAHGGAHTAYGVPEFGEETLSAFGAAHRSWGAVVEASSQLTADGTPVAIHDATLDRTTDCTGPVSGRTLAQLGECRVDVLGRPGGPLGSGAAACPEAIPTILEVLTDARDGGATVNLEIPDPAAADRVMDVVIASGLPKERLIVESFSSASLDVAETRLPGVATSLLTTQAANAAGPGAAVGRYEWVSPEWPVDAAYVTGAHGLGLKVVPYTLDAAAQVQAAAGLGVDALITDDVGMARRALALPDGSDPIGRSCPAPAPPAGERPLPPPGPPKVELLVPSLASDAYVSPRMLLRWRGRGDDDGRAEGFLAAVRPTGLKRAADWRSLVFGSPARAAVYTAQPGSTFVLRVSARDRSGTYGPPALKAVTVPLDDRDAVVRRAGPWRRARSAGAWTGRVSRASSRRARLTLRFSGRRLRVIARRSPAAGQLAVTIDGRRRVVPTAGAVTPRAVVFDSGRLRGRRHRATLRPAGGGRVEIDAIAPG